jgi:NAD(P)-dependent dehydrogenase (short-subunit alcohol dehydrogenase family)
MSAVRQVESGMHASPAGFGQDGAMKGWSIEAIPHLDGRRVVVTGGTSGIGLETALALAGAGAAVTITGRETARGEAACARIGRRHAAARVQFAVLDLASLESVRDFAVRQAGPLDLLVNNAGVMAIPERRLTADGFEMQFGVNHLGHFALAALLLPCLRAAAQARLVVVSSLAHRRGVIRLDDLQGERGYGAWRAYTQSKLANLLFAREFARRSEAGGWGVCAIAAHPGWAATNIASAGPRMGRATLLGRLTESLMPVFGQSAAQGALPILHAATAPDAQCGGYYGPARWGETRGAPVSALIARPAQDDAMAAALWERSEQLAGVRFPVRQSSSSA